MVVSSPAELFAARSREQSLPQRSHGQKDFLPDSSKSQEDNLQICRTEQWELLREERVERLGSLGRGVWKPKEDLVELTLPAGKFWQTMGFTEGGRQCLLPEEAVYLLECGTLQLFYRDLPLSVQEAYERLLYRGSVTLPHYQVYSHLKRLGYIVTRFDPSVVQTPYERQLNLDSCGTPSRKRKRSSSPCSSKSEKNGNGDKEKKNISYLSPSPAEDMRNTLAAESFHQKRPCAGNERGRGSSDSDTQSPSGASHTAAHVGNGGTTCSGGSRWDFSKIVFPNCAPHQACVDLPDPEPTLLPENVLGRPIDISRWLRKLNYRREKFSRREQEQRDWERKYKISVNADPKVKQCSNWKEYKGLLQERACQRDRERPPHLWKSTVQPLLRPGSVMSTASVLEEITVMGLSSLLDDCKRIKRIQIEPKIHFNLYQADGSSEFRKSKPGKPYARLCVRSFDEQIPSLLTLKAMAYQSGDVPVVFALVDDGEVSFYTFKDFQLPVDVYP
ncbi:tRNA-splicing endonuclease subunit Sen54 [Gastrophryne carolinensis]